MKLKHKMARAAVERKKEQRARAQEQLQHDPETAAETRSQTAEEFLESIGRGDVEITNPPSSRDLKRRIAEIKIAQLERENTRLAICLNQIRRLIEC